MRRVPSVNSVDKRLSECDGETPLEANDRCCRRTLQDLKDHLGVVAHDKQGALVDAYLLRCLEATEHTIPKAVQLLKQRRAFEQSFQSIRVTPPILAALRCGAISTIGRDLCGRLVLYLYPKHIKQDTLDEQDVHRLVIIMMEFILGCCMVGGEPPQESASHSPTLMHTGGANSMSDIARQQVVVLVNEEGFSLSSGNVTLSKVGMLFTVIAKQYPGLIVQVLLYQPSCDIKLAVKQVLPGCSAAAGAATAVEIVMPNHIQNFISNATLPEELGGKNGLVGTPSFFCTFADAVLRHWYLEVSYILTEEAPARPIWQLPPCIGVGCEWFNLGRCCSAVPPVSCLSAGCCAAAGGKEGLCQKGEFRGDEMEREQLHALVGDWMRESYSPHLRHSGQSRCFSAEPENDDRFGSLLSDAHFRSCCEAELSPSEVWLGVDGFNGGDERETPMRELQRERSCRFMVERQLLSSQMNQCTASQLDARAAEGVTCALKAARVELEALVSSTVAYAKESEARGDQLTLLQLLERTVMMIKNATNEIPCESDATFTKPAKGKEDKSSCCAVM